jgi:hypothetical protein
MHVNQESLTNAVKQGIISTAQANELWAYWEKYYADTPTFRFSHMLYYLGGLTAISAVTLFVTQAWETLQGWPLFGITALLFFIGLALNHHFLMRNLRIPAGIMATFSLAVVPLAVYNIMLGLGYSPNLSLSYVDYHYQINWYWFPMEVATLAVGLILFLIYRFPFLLFPVSITLWYMSMDLVPLIFGMNDYTFVDRATFSLLFGIVIIVFAAMMDVKYSDDRQDYGFWLYLIGVMTFWGGLTCQPSSSELGSFMYCLINIAMIMASVFFNRRVFAVFGAFGVLGYLGHLARSVFTDSLIFPIVLVLFGFIIILAAAKWAEVELRLQHYLAPYIPTAFKKRR